MRVRQKVQKVLHELSQTKQSRRGSPDAYGFTAQISEPTRTWAETAEVIGMDSEDPVLTGFKLKAGRNGPEAA